MRFANLHDWLAWQETLHPSEIDLGLERVSSVLQRMSLGQPAFCIISVAGTNGKGSCVAMLEAIYRAAGYSVGAYTSPHIKKYNERITIDSVSVSDQQLCEVFDEIDRARGEISLTYFEFGTLAAIALMVKAEVDIAVMEVGLGGRLDAVNVLDADVALITSVGLDHQDWLGNDRESIALEKAGIARSGRPVVCGETQVPDSLLRYLGEIEAPLYLINRDFKVIQAESEPAVDSWGWDGYQTSHADLPIPRLGNGVQLINAASVLEVVELLQSRFPVTVNDIRQGITMAFIPGRFQVIPGDVTLIVDVAHNAQAAQALASHLGRVPCEGATIAVFGCFRDKDLEGIVKEMSSIIDQWYVATLEGPRARPASEISTVVKQLSDGAVIKSFDSISLAKESAIKSAASGDRIILFGSFFVAAEVL